MQNYPIGGLDEMREVIHGPKGGICFEAEADGADASLRAYGDL
jgi:hypothetical protein